jgi:hypothetical protein
MKGVINALTTQARYRFTVRLRWQPGTWGVLEKLGVAGLAGGAALMATATGVLATDKTRADIPANGWFVLGGVLFVIGFALAVAGAIGGWWTSRPGPLSPQGDLDQDVQVTNATRFAAPLRGSVPEHLLVVEVRANGPRLIGCVAKLTRIEGSPAPSPGTGPQAPIRLYWTPSNSVSTRISQNATDSIEIVRVTMGRSPQIRTPDNHLPWGVPSGTWSFDLELTVDGYAAAQFTGTFAATSSPVTGGDARWVGTVDFKTTA